MADRSKIEWTDASWNPVRAAWRRPDGSTVDRPIGWHCEHVSEGCRNCYAEDFNRRLGTKLDYKPGNREVLDIFLDEKLLVQPLRWKRPRRIFVGSMTDLGADFVTDDMLDKIFAVAALCPQHIFQFLTKRSSRMLRYWTDRSAATSPTGFRCPRLSHVLNVADRLGRRDYPAPFEALAKIVFAGGAQEFLPNVWMGGSCEDQTTADERIPDLLATPAAIRFISAEPALGRIDLTNHCNGHYFFDSLRGTRWHDDPDGVNPAEKFVPGLDWVICGGESGRHARPMHPDWARSLRDQCAAAGVPFFFKQWGEWADTEDWPSELQESYELEGKADGNNVRVGKRRAGRLLDGVEHKRISGGRLMLKWLKSYGRAGNGHTGPDPDAEGSGNRAIAAGAERRLVARAFSGVKRLRGTAPAGRTGPGLPGRNSYA